MDGFIPAVYLLYFRVNIHDHSEYLITSHEVECWLTRWVGPPCPTPASHCIQLLLRIDAGLSWRRPYQITLQTNLTPLLLWPSVSATSVLIYFWCPDVFLVPKTLLLSSIYSFYWKKWNEIQMKRITVGMETHCFLLLLMFWCCNINCRYLFFCGNTEWKWQKPPSQTGHW